MVTELAPPPKPELVEMLRSVPLFSKFAEADLGRIADITVVRRYEQDQVVVNLGEVEEDLHIIMEGSAKVSVPQVCGQLGQGDFIGLDSLRVSGAMSSRQVSAMGDGFTTISIPRSKFEALRMTKGVERRAKMIKAAARMPKSDNPVGSDDAVVSFDKCPASGLPTVTDYSKTPHDRDMIMAAVKNNRVLGEVMYLTEEQCAIFVETVHLVHVERGSNVFSKGDRGTAFFIVHEGILKVHLDGSVGIKLRHGDTFGELALMYDEPRSATIEAVVDCKLWVMPQKAFREVSQISARRKLIEYSRVLQRVPVLQSHVDSSQFEMLASVVEETVFMEGDMVCIKGQDCGTLFLVFEGECTYEQNGETKTLHKGDWMGEEQLLENVPATATVSVRSDTASVLVLDADGYNFIMTSPEETPRPSQSCCRKHLGRSSSGPKGVSVINKIKESKGNGILKKCEVVGALGEGSFGLVMLVQHKETKKEYALKGLRKDHLQKEDHLDMVRNERGLLNLMSSDFIVHLEGSYEDSNFYFLLLELASGGELFDIYTEHQLWGKIDHAKFYIASVSLGLQHMHSKRVVWRDLKLENCLINAKGYLKLTDMGIAKLVIGKTYTVCGTADYFAPETLRQLGHNRGADWWACGVLLFIMIAGRSPFDAPDVQQIYKNIIKGMSKVAFPKHCPSDAADIIKALCKKKPEDRITMQKGGMNNLMEMPFFDKFCWDDLASKRMPAPFSPSLLDHDKVAKKKLTQAVDIDWEDLQDWDEDVSAEKVAEGSLIMPAGDS